MSAIAGTFADFKLIKTRSCAQIVIEVPIEQADAALKALGGLPRPAKERWVGIAPLEAAPSVQDEEEGLPPHIRRMFGDDYVATSEPPRRQFHDLSATAQAGIKCADADFQRWLTETKVMPRGQEGQPFDAQSAADWVRRYCGIKSRSELDSNPRAAQAWKRLLGTYEDARLGRR